MESPQQESDTRREEFVRLFQRHERGLFRYVLSLVLNIAAAEEISQNTSLLLWKEFDRFELNTDFGAWARTIAYYEVLRYRKKNATAKVLFDSELLQVLADRATVRYDRLVDRQGYLTECVARLSEFKQQVVRLYYRSGMTTKTVAEQLGKNVGNVEMTLVRIRRALHACIEAAMRREDRA